MNHSEASQPPNSSLPADRRALIAGIGGLAAGALLLSSRSAQAGPLNPPSGPVASTGRTTQEIFDKVAASEPRIAINATNTPGDADSLFKITQPGSYYLTGNITGVVGKHGIEIAASGVTIDLNGFDLVGVPAMGAFDGVSVTLGGLTNIAVRNGSVRNWGDEGVNLGSFGAINCRVEGVLASGNTGNGIRIGDGGTLLNCSASQNTGNGIESDDGSTVSNCSAYDNTLDGIEVGAGCTVLNCAASNNTGSGIDAGIGSTVSNCSARGNTDNGINASTGCTVLNCSAAFNLGNGIGVVSGCTVVDCTARGNSLDGIVCTLQCVIRGNTCAGNGNTGTGAGIQVLGNDNRIEGNNCANADLGIDVNGTSNIIIKNTCSANGTSWSIVAGNSVGAIVVAGTNAAAINGNGPVASTLGSTDPNANFSY